MHKCDAVVVCCIDFRFQKYIRGWTDQVLQGKNFDLIAIAGSTKDFGMAQEQIDVSVKLHNIESIYIIHHENCGAYGTESTFENHHKDLIKAKDAISKKHQGLTVSLFYLHLDGQFEEVL